MSSPTQSPDHLRASLSRDGFVLIPHALDPHELATYRTAAQHATALARAGKWPYTRTTPKQFPPWSTHVSSQGIWGVQHLLHPAMPSDLRNTFVQSYFHPNILGPVSALLQCPQEALVMELYNMLVRPDVDFALRWHRDDIPPSATAVEELQRLQEPMVHAQWNLALHDDASLIVVPGSHARARTEFERYADLYENAMPGQVVVKMQAGDLLFYNNNILHRGVYDCSVERMTLHGTIGVVGKDVARARNILQHGIGEWAAECEFDGLEREVRGVAERMRDRLIEMGRGGDVGFSQKE